MRPQSKLISGFMLAWVPKKSLSLGISKRSAFNVKYPQGHLPFFTIHITKRCQNYSKKALMFDLSALCGLHEMDSRP